MQRACEHCVSGDGSWTSVRSKCCCLTGTAAVRRVAAGAQGEPGRGRILPHRRGRMLHACVAARHWRRLVRSICLPPWPCRLRLPCATYDTSRHEQFQWATERSGSEWALCSAQAACNLHRQSRAGRPSCSMRLRQVWPVAQGAGAMRVRRRAGHQLRRHHHAPAALRLQQLQVHSPGDAGAQQDNSFQALMKAVVLPLRSSDPACTLPKSGGLTLLSAHGRLTTSGEYVPVGPAACCRACLSPRVAPLDACADLNYCSGHGVCALGACVTSRAARAGCTTGQRTGS